MVEKKKKSRTSGFVFGPIFFIVMSLVLLMITIGLIKRTITKGGEQMHEAYDASMAMPKIGPIMASIRSATTMRSGKIMSATGRLLR